MLPPTVTLKPAISSIRPVSAVVVDFPFVPVIAITRPSSHLEASSTSPITATPRARAAAMTGCSDGTPGLNTTRSALVKVSSLWPPSSSPTPSASSARASATSDRVSDSVTRAPRRTSSSAAAIPLRAAPATVIRFPATSNAFMLLFCSCHRSFNVVRLNNAKMIATITKRVITFGSLQPINSK